MKLSADLTKSLVLHGVLFGLLAFQLQGVTIKVKPSDAGSNQPILEAVAVKESELASELKRQATHEQRVEKAKQQKLAEIQKKTQEVEQQKKQAEEKLRATQQKTVALQKQQKAEALAKTKLEAERAALQLKEKEIAAQKVAQQKALDEQKKKMQAELEKEKAAVAEQKKKAETEKARIAEEKAKAEAEKARLAKVAEAERQKALSQESEKLLQQALQDEMDQNIAQDEIERYYGVIVKKIQQNWRRDYGEEGSLSCRIQVRLLPSGEVSDVKIIQSSGNAQFDRQATLAVVRSSPLPLPESQTARQAFLAGFDFLFKPEG
jgi:colicin import membrane protein